MFKNRKFSIGTPITKNLLKNMNVPVYQKIHQAYDSLKPNLEKKMIKCYGLFQELFLSCDVIQESYFHR
jgi:hypothetical protein